LFALLAKLPHLPLRRVAAEELGALNDQRAVAPLLALMKETDAPLRIAAANSLGQLNTAGMAVPATTPLAEAMLPLAIKGDDTQRANAIAALGALKDSVAVPMLIVLLGDVKMSFAAIEALGVNGTPQAVDAMLTVIKEGESNADFALISIGHLKERRTIPACIDAMSNGASSKYASYALSQITGEQFTTQAEWQAWWKAQGEK